MLTPRVDPRRPQGAFLAPLLAPLWFPLAPFWPPLGSVWLPLAPLWFPFGSHWAPFGALWAPFGLCLAPFAFSSVIFLAIFGLPLAPFAPYWRKNLPSHNLFETFSLHMAPLRPENLPLHDSLVCHLVISHCHPSVTPATFPYATLHNTVYTA